MATYQTSSPTTDGGPSRRVPPIKRLPFDILSQIFLECLLERHLPTVSANEAPVLLGRICSHWRAVALSIPHLWASLNFIFALTRDRKQDVIAAAEWKNRAGSCLLSYHLWYQPDSEGLLDVILPHCSLWRHIEGHLELDGWNKFYATMSQGAPHLQYLEIGVSAHQSSPVLRGVCIDIPIPGAPQLQSLCTTTAFTFNFRGMEAQCLRKLDSMVLSLDDCWSFLKYCPNLEHVSAICNTGNSFTLSSEVIEAKELKHFKLSLIGAGFDRLLDVILAPSLESLELCQSRGDNTVPRLQSFLERSGARLVEMHINAPLNSDQIVDCLRNTPALTSLELYNGFTDTVIQALTMGPPISHNSICAKLQSVFFEVQSKIPLASLDIMKTMILSRWGGVGGKMRLSNGWPEDDWERKLCSVTIISRHDVGCVGLAEEGSIMLCMEEGLEIVEDYY